MSLILGRPQPLASHQMDSATPVEVDTDWYWTSVKMQQLDAHIQALVARRRHDPQRGTEIGEELAGLHEEWESLFVHREELDVAYYKRPWSRAWLVTSSDGHIHSASYCTTFQRNTTCTLLPQASGMSHAELVNAAGEKACTVCFPDAPAKPCTLRDPLTAQEQDELAIAKAAKQAQAAVKAITTPEGAPLYAAREFDHEGLNGPLVKTEVAANRLAMEALKNLGWYGVEHPFAKNWIETVRRMVLALAAKRGTTALDEFNAMDKKVEKAIKRDGGRSAFDPHVIRTLL